MNDEITIGDKYGPAMEIADQAEADAYYEKCVEHCMRFGKTRAEAEAIEKQNLRYYAVYYSHEIRARVERLYRCAHPVFGTIAANGAPSPEEAFNKGVELGEKMQDSHASN